MKLNLMYSNEALLIRAMEKTTIAKRLLIDAQDQLSQINIDSDELEKAIDFIDKFYNKLND